MATVSSTDGSPTNTGWKRRSSALSFSTCLRYSSSVVAPMQRSSPRASAGLSMLAASTAPSAPPAPTSVCSSSMNRMMPPAAASISFSTALRRSSNSPRYLLPAISAPRSSARIFLSLSDSGTSPVAMRSAMPSTMAVLPTPGSPIRTGLFLVRRESTCIERRISSSRPMTGSSLPVRASSVRSRVYFASAWYLPSAPGSVTRCVPRTSASAFMSASLRTPASLSAAAGGAEVLARKREQQVLAGDVFVLELLRLAGRLLDEVLEPPADIDVRRGAADLRLRIQRLGHRLPDNGRVDAELAQDRARDAVGLVEQRGEDVFRRQLLVGAAGGQFVRRLQRFLGLDCQLVESHLPRARLSTDGNVTRLAARPRRPPARRENGVGLRCGSK